MKLFDDKNGHVIQETVDYLMSEKNSGSTVNRIRGLILNLAGYDYHVDLRKLVVNADVEHMELITNVIASCSPANCANCRFVIAEIAAKLLDKLGEDDNKRFFA